MGQASGQGIPKVLFLGLALLAEFGLSFASTEPYPSITMPGFASITVIDDPESVAVHHMRVIYGDGSDRLLSLSELFGAAPPSQWLPMIRRLEVMTGEDHEWQWIDEVAGRDGPEIATVEIVLMAGNGRSKVLRRIDRS